MRRAESRPARPCLVLCLLALATHTHAAPHAALPQPASDTPHTRSDGASSWRLDSKERSAIEAFGPRIVEAINAPDDDARRTLVGELYAREMIEKIGIDRLAAQLRSIGERMPGLRFASAELTESRFSDRISRVLHIYARRDEDTMWKDIQIRLSPVPPHLLEQVSFIAEVTEPIALPNGAITSPQTIEWLDAYVDRLHATYDLSCGVLIAHGEHVIYERYAGFANAARTTPITDSTAFGMASASKMFTAMGIATLVAEGKLALADPIGTYLSDFPNPIRARTITIGQLLSHASGVGEYWTTATAPRVAAAMSTADLLPLVYEAAQAFEPGTRHAYSNSNYVLAGTIVERLRETPFEEWAQSALFDRLGLADTGYFAANDQSRPIARALVRDGDAWKELDRTGRGTAAGGCFSTPRDILRFMLALRAGRIIPRELLADMTASHVAPGVEADSDYGYGSMRTEGGGVWSYGHGGIARGANAEVRYFPGPDITIILLNNQDNGAYDDLRRNITRLVTGER